MLALSRRNVISGALIGAVGVTAPVALAAQGDGGGTPANKAVAAGSKRVVVGANQTETIATATFKTSKPTDLLMSVSLECTLLTALTTTTESPSATAQSRVRAWLEIDGQIVPIESSSTPPQDGSTPPAGTDADKVTFCDRTYSRTVTDAEAPEDGVDTEDDYIRTKSSHAFNWVKLNAGSGVHTVALVAEFLEGSTGLAETEAIVGNRTLIIEPTKMANNADIAESGTSNSGS